LADTSSADPAEALVPTAAGVSGAALLCAHEVESEAVVVRGAGLVEERVGGVSQCSEMRRIGEGRRGSVIPHNALISTGLSPR